MLKRFLFRFFCLFFLSHIAYALVCMLSGYIRKHLSPESNQPITPSYKVSEQEILA